MMLYHVLLWKTYNLLKWECLKIVYLGTNTSNTLQSHVQLHSLIVTVHHLLSFLSPSGQQAGLHLSSTWLSDLLWSMELCQSRDLREFEHKRSTVTFISFHP